MLFMFLRYVLSKQKTDADVLTERRQIKRGIKKYFKQNNVIAENMRNTVLVDIMAKNKQAEESRFEN